MGFELHYGMTLVSNHPTVAAVLSAADHASQEIAPQDVRLEAKPPDNALSTILSIEPITSLDPETPSGWLVRYTAAGSKRSRVAVEYATSSSEYVHVAHFGVHESLLKGCCCSRKLVSQVAAAFLAASLESEDVDWVDLQTAFRLI